MSQSWYVRHIRDLSLEVVKEKFPDSSAVLDSNPFTTILHNLNLTLPTGSRCLLISVNGLGTSTLLRIIGGRYLISPDSDVHFLGLNSFRDTKIKFHCAYIDTGWGMRKVDFTGVGIPLMSDTLVHGMMEKLQRSYPERQDELVEILGIYLNWRMHQLSEAQRRQTFAYYDWSDTTIQGDFII